MGEAVGQLPVVGEEQEPLASRVQAAHRVEPLTTRYQAQRRRTAPEIQGVAQVALGLVEEDVDLLPPGDGPSVHLDGVPGGVHFGAQFGDHLAVDPHPSLQDQRLALPPRGDPGAGKHLLQTLHQLPSCSSSSSGGSSARSCRPKYCKNSKVVP